MKSLFYLSFVLLFIFSCSIDSDETQHQNNEEKDIYSFEEIKSIVEQTLSSGKIFDWQMQNNSMIFSAAMLADSFISIGYNISPDFDLQSNIHIIDVNSEEWTKARIELEELILEEESVFYPAPISIRDLRPYGTIEQVPQIIVKIQSKETINKLRDHPNVRFVEPLGFSISDEIADNRSDTGCGGAPNYGINSNDYTTIAPGIKEPWNFSEHNIPQAWNNSSKGDNVKLCIIDTGGSFSQDNIGGNFNSGQSSGRTVEKYSTKYSGSWWWKTLDSPDDPCGHGTSMAGLASAPRSNDGNAVGVAYQSNLMTIRAVEDVIISTSNERKGVRDALILAGNSSTKIISMSIGTPFYSSTVADGVHYAYNKGKLMFGAAGTSLSWLSWYPVIFPANMSQVSAITGVKDATNLVKCETCHDGPEVDFVIVMERASTNSRTSLALARYGDQPKYVGGSSCATATTAGIAAMVWAENPSASRQNVLDVLKTSSSYYPTRHSDLGWGTIDALQAVNGL
jgi:hypothetical protein